MWPETVVGVVRALLVGPGVENQSLARKMLGDFLAAGGGNWARPSAGADHVQELANDMAHEIGHLVDWLPDKTLSRGNLLARLMVLP